MLSPTSSHLSCRAVWAPALAVRVSRSALKAGRSRFRMREIRPLRVAMSSATLAALIYFCSGASSGKPAFRVIAFFTAKEDPAHISFVHEAERWFPAVAVENHFSFDTTSDWHNLDADFFAPPHVVGFLATPPENPPQ